MSHDPRCRGIDEWHGGYCDCDLIAEVRADEREKAAFSLRVAAKMMMIDGLPINAETAKVLHRCATSIYCGRGES